jgi:hypothetical protein
MAAVKRKGTPYDTAYLEDQHSELVGIRAVAFLVDYV